MDVIKFALLHCLAALFFWFTVLCSQAILHWNRTVAPNLPVPTAIRFFQAIIGSVALGCALFGAWLIRFAWRRWRTPRPVVAPRTFRSDVERELLSTGNYNEWDIFRMTGAAWLLVILGFAAPFLVDWWNPIWIHDWLETPGKLVLGYIGGVVAVVGLGFLLLPRIGVRLLNAPELDATGEAFQKIDSDDIPDPRRG